MNNKVAVIIEARMTSSRLPGKVLKTVDGKPMLKFLIDRLRTIKSIDEIIIATTINKEDDPIVKFSENEKVSYFRGSELNVLERVYFAAKKFKVDQIIKITSDCPIIDPSIVEHCMRVYDNNDIDFLSNAHIRSYPDGMDVVIFNFPSLEKSYQMANDSKELEHVSLFMRRNPQIFRSIYLVAPPELHWPELGLTLDEKDDFNLISNIISTLGSNSIFSCGEVIQLLRKKPELLKINKDIKRKVIY
jgi:spore coat polysaccharide biosynthesis protein SpsF